MSKTGRDRAHQIHRALGRLELRENHVHSSPRDYSRQNMKQEMMDMIEELEEDLQEQEEEDKVPFYLIDKQKENQEKR
jgi:hypothetical protein